MVVQRDLIKKALARVAQKLNIKKWRYEIQTTDGNAVNYVANVVPVAIIDESCGVKTYFIIKADSSVVEEEFEPMVKGTYEREVYFYLTISPLIKKVIDISYVIPECYYADSSEGNRVVVLQDMTEEGFKRFDKGRFLDHDHLTITLEAVAKLHASSLLLEAQNIKAEDDRVMNPSCLANEPMYVNTLHRCFKKYGVDLFKGTQHEKIFEDLYGTMDNVVAFLDKCVTRTLVYGHGDIWKENLLFKYSEEKPTKVCLLDYQMCHLMSPAYDVLFLIMASTDSIVRRNHYHTLLSTYYRTLDRLLQANGIDSNKVYSEQDFHNDLKLVFPKCFNVTVFSYALWLGFDNLTSFLGITTGSTISEVKENENFLLFMEIIGNVITDFRDFGIIK